MQYMAKIDILGKVDLKLSPKIYSGGEIVLFSTNASASAHVLS